MKKPETPLNEEVRLRSLREYEILDTAPEAAFDALTKIAAHIAGAPIALVSLVDTDRQWFKSRYGLDAPETPRDVSFCGHVVAAEAPLMVADAFQDERFFDNPLVTGEPRVRFYAGFPLRTPDGFVVGTLCAIDHEARELSAKQREMLALLAQQVVDQLELRRRSRRLEAQGRFFEVSLSLLCTADDKMYFRELNPAWNRTLGWTLDELRARPFLSFVHPDDVALTVAEASRVLEGGPTTGFECRWRHKDGRWVQLAWNAAAKDGVFYAAAIDVSETRRTEALLRESEARQRAVVDSASVSIIATTPEGGITVFNRGAERMLGYEANEVVGKVTPAILHDGDEVVARAQSLSAELGTAVEPGFEVFVVKARVRPDENEWTYIRKDRSRLSVLLSITAIRDAHEQIVGFLGVATDISERKRGERELRQFKKTLDSTKDAILIFDPTSLRISYANQGAVDHVGYSVDELLQKTPLDLKPLFDEPRYRQLLDPLVTGQSEVARNLST